MQRAVKALLLAAAVCVNFTACFPHTELNDKAIVEAVAIDYKNDMYTVTLQYYNLSSSGSRTQVDASKPNVLTASASGDNVYSTLEAIELSCGRELMLGINQLIIIGREALSHDLSDILSFAKTYYQSHPNVYICAADGNAADIMKIKFLEGTVSTEKLIYLLKNADMLGEVKIPTIIDVFISLETGQRALCLPLLRVLDNDSDTSEDGKSVEVAGGVLLKDGLFMSDLDLGVTSGIQMLSNTGSNSSVTFEYESEHISIELMDTSTTLSPYIDSGRLVVNVKVDADGRFMDALSNGGNIDKTDDFERLAAEEMQKHMDAASKYSVNVCHTDILYLEIKLKHSDYTAWLKCEENFEELLRFAEFKFDISVNISRYGLER